MPLLVKERSIGLIRSVSKIQAASKEIKADIGTYEFFYSDEYWSMKMTAILDHGKASVTQIVAEEGNAPEVYYAELPFDRRKGIYPNYYGCPIDSLVYSFNQFGCDGAREARMWFSESPIDLYEDGSAAFVMGFADFEFNSTEFFYPCTKT